MTPTDRPGEASPESATPRAITMALGALAASCYASYRRRMTGAAAAPSDLGPDAASPSSGSQSLPQAPQPAPDGSGDAGPTG